MSETATSDVTVIPAAGLGGPGRPDPARCSIAAIEALTRVAGPDMGLTQLQLDVSSQAITDPQVMVRSRIDKRTKSIVFVSVEAHAGEQMVFLAQALFSAKR